MSAGARARILGNAFFVLGVTPRASDIEIEREAGKLLAQLGLGIEAAANYATPVGAGRRDVELVRWALHELRDPAKRAVHELWAGMPEP